MTEEIKKEDEFQPKQISQADVQKALTAMHHGLLNMQARLDDHEKVIEKLIVALNNLAEASAPTKGFRQPSKKVN